MPHLCMSSIMKCYFKKIFHLSIAHKRDHSWGIRWIFVILNCLFLMINAHPQQVKTCTPGLETAGWTEPENDIFVKYGDDLQIWCNLNETYIAKNNWDSNSSYIHFMCNNNKVEQKFITTINRTTALLTIKSPPAGWYTYSCDLNIADDIDTFVCLNTVFVAYEPQPPRNFTCKSYNWESMTCTWEVSKNYIPTTNKLFFKQQGTRGRKLFPCPITEVNSCTWTQYTNPIYRQTYKTYMFIMQIQNMFGNKTVEYEIDHYAIVIPAKPVDISVTNTTSNSATLCWKLDFPMMAFPPGLTHKVMYQNFWDYNKNYKVIINDMKPHLHKRCSHLTGLYANLAYEARVYLRSARAVEEDMYSEPIIIIFRTLPMLPSFPPRTDIGSFEIIENHGSRDVYLYWQFIQRYYENGNKFKYLINHVKENGHRIDHEPIEMTKTYAKFEGLNFDEYRFKIVSENEIGISKNYTEIIIPSRDEMPYEPIGLTTVVYGRGLYELSWKPPIIDKDVTNYTIFLCDNECDSSNQCTGYLNWTHVSVNTTVYDITVPDSNKVYQFAISANTNKGSSGMTWSSCTLLHSKVLDRMKSIWINRIGSNFIEVEWKLDCRIDIVEEVKIYYCPLIVSPLNIECRKPEYISVTSYPYIINGIVKNLRPDTTYMFEVTMVTRYGESQSSKSLYGTTLKASISSSL